MSSSVENEVLSFNEAQMKLPLFTFVKKCSAADTCHLKTVIRVQSCATIVKADISTVARCTQ